MADEAPQGGGGGGQSAGGSNPAVIIIKKKNRGGGGGHHGGAWKVAYADFVTAMMAFFLLLWLLASTTEEQKQGIAHYFNPPNNSTEYGGGDGILGGAAAVVADNHAPSDTPDLPTQADANNGEDLALSASEDATFRNVAEEFKKAVMNIPELQAMVENMIVDITPEGLRIQITDTEKRPLFEGHSAAMQPYAERMVAILTTVLAPLPNKLALGGHTDVVPLKTIQPGYSNWDLSVDRAQTMRKVMLAEGINEKRITRVSGHAAQDLLLKDQPTHVKNRRLSVIVLRSKRGALATFTEQGLISPQAGDMLY
jgi:chemotaxis protein MotB